MYHTTLFNAVLLHEGKQSLPSIYMQKARQANSLARLNDSS